MGTYTNLYGKISINKNDIKSFENKFNKYFERFGWEITFSKVFQVIIPYEDAQYVYLYFYPERNSFKLFGYPNNFTEYFGFYKENMKLIEYAKIFGDIEDGSHLFLEIKNNDENEFKMNVIDIDTIINVGSFEKWHKEFITNNRFIIKR